MMAEISANEYADPLIDDGTSGIDPSTAQTRIIHWLVDEKKVSACKAVISFVKNEGELGVLIAATAEASDARFPK